VRGLNKSGSFYHLTLVAPFDGLQRLHKPLQHRCSELPIGFAAWVQIDPEYGEQLLHLFADERDVSPGDGLLRAGKHSFGVFPNLEYLAIRQAEARSLGSRRERRGERDTGLP